jgi:hypothetical protein
LLWRRSIAGRACRIGILFVAGIIVLTGTTSHGKAQSGKLLGRFGSVLSGCNW